MPNDTVAFHTLFHNRDLTDDEYAQALSRAALVQKAFDEGGSRVADDHVHKAANVWEGLVPGCGAKLHCDYHYVNNLRIHAPFAGFHLPVMDRLDQPRFSGPGEETLLHIRAATTRESMWERICEAIDPMARMQPFVGMQRLVTRNIPAHYIVDTPKIFGEMGVIIDGILSNPDTILCQTRINALYAGGALLAISRIIDEKGTCRILEIGSGHGALAHAIMSIFEGRIEYVCCDLPSSLQYAAIYLGHFAARSKVVTLDDCSVNEMRGRSGCTFVPNYLLDKVVNTEMPIDVAINTMSMPEMSADQVDYYCRVMANSFSKNGFFYEANNVVLDYHVDCKEIFSKHFSHRRKITCDFIGLGGEMHELWSNEPVVSENPQRVAPSLSDVEEAIFAESAGRALLEMAAEIPEPLRRTLMLRTGQLMAAAGSSKERTLARLDVFRR